MKNDSIRNIYDGVGVAVGGAVEVGVTIGGPRMM